MMEHAAAVERIILWNPKAGVSEAETRQVAERGAPILSAIAGVESVLFGIATHADARYRHYARLRFRDGDALAVFDADPSHHAYVNDEFSHILADELVLTYAIQS